MFDPRFDPFALTKHALFRECFVRVRVCVCCTGHRKGTHVIPSGMPVTHIDIGLFGIFICKSLLSQSKRHKNNPLCFDKKKTRMKNAHEYSEYLQEPEPAAIIPRKITHDRLKSPVQHRLQVVQHPAGGVGCLDARPRPQPGDAARPVLGGGGDEAADDSRRCNQQRVGPLGLLPVRLPVTYRVRGGRPATLYRLTPEEEEEAAAARRREGGFTVVQQYVEGVVVDGIIYY